jgi:Spy/CpxP family protein refolding chaperone
MERLVKKTVLALTAAVACGLISFAAPASAAPAPAPMAGVAVDHTDMSSQRWHRRKVCKVRTVVRRDRFGRRMVRKVRTCR